jgi:TPR repeat protein
MNTNKDAANNGDADAMMMLGLIFGSKDYGLYDMDKAQNYMELALVRGDLEAYNYLVRILRAKLAARVALENENMENFEKLSQQDKEKLIRQLAKEAAPESTSHHQCANINCDKKEVEPGLFKRCGRCQRVSYCSRDCQKEHWKLGHKAVCKTQTQQQDQQQNQ